VVVALLAGLCIGVLLALGVAAFLLPPGESRLTRWRSRRRKSRRRA
jgi:hypothetical protein